MEQLQQIFQSFFNQFTDVFPKLMGALALVLGGWLFARTLASILQRLLETVKADKLTEKLQEVEIFSKAGIEIKASVFLSKAVYYVLLLIFITAACDSLGLVIVSQQIALLITYMPRFMTAALMFVGGAILANTVKKILETTFRSLGIHSGRIISAAVFYFLLVTISITALEQGGLNTAFLTQNLQIILAGVVVAFAVGFGLSSRDLLKNILAASYTKRKFKIGMIVKIGDYKGTVMDVDSTALTILLDASGHRVVVPQHNILNSQIEVFEPSNTP